MKIEKECAVLLTIYSKTEKESISDDELKTVLREFEKSEE